MLKIIFTIFLLSLNFSISITPPVEELEEAMNLTKTIPYDNSFELKIATMEDGNNDRLRVKYDVVEQDIYVECNVSDFTFNKDKAGSLKRDGEGHIQLYINNNKVDSIFTSSFIIKALPVGTYNIRIELVHNDYTPYGVAKEFEVKL